MKKEDQPTAMYGVDFEDLEEIPIRYRDASIHYQYIPDNNSSNDSNDSNDPKDENSNENQDNNDKPPKPPTKPTRFVWCWGTNMWSSAPIN